MELVIPSSVRLLGVTSTSSTSRAPLNISSTSKSGKYTLSTISTRCTICVSFHLTSDEKLIYDLNVPVKWTRRSRLRGWKSLRIYKRCKDASGQRVDDTFRAYRVLVSRGADQIDAILIFARPDTSSFLSHIPDHTPLGDIALTGTHESCALYGFPISQCQQPSTPIERQLADGVRFLDVRLRVVGDDLLMYHGPRPQRSSLNLLLSTLHSFLFSHPSETLILSLKEESPPFHPHFSFLVYEAFKPYLNKWFLEERIPLLGEVRGKGMLLTRFDRNVGDTEEWKEGMGIHPYTWPDSRPGGFEWDCHGTVVRTQDWYRVKTFLAIPEKFEMIVKHLEPTLSLTQPPSSTPFTLSYTSASYFPLSLPTIIAKGFGWPQWGVGVEGINNRFYHWLLCCLVDGKKVRACVPSDYYRQCGEGYGEGLAELLVQMNLMDEGQLD